MSAIKIRNNFTGSEITVDASKPVTAKKILAWRSKLHAADCTSGDDLGGRGKQAHQEAYDALLSRAQRVVATGQDEIYSNAYHTGFEAAKQGEPRNANPYASCTWDHDQWFAGWDDEMEG